MLWVTNGSSGMRHIWTGEDSCSECAGSMFPVGFHIRTWKKTGEHADTLLCSRCSDKIPEQMPSSPIQERRQIIISEVKPRAAIVVTPRKPDVTNGRMSVYDAANENKAPSLNVDDRTRLAGRADSTFLDGSAPVLIGADVKATIDSKDHVIEDEREAFDLLEDLTRGDS